MAAGAFSRTRGSLVKISPMEFEKILINTKTNVASTISDFDESPQVTYLPLGGATESGVPATAAAGGISSKSPSDFLPTIPSSDFANNSIALSESIYNVVV